jgi:protoheme IX farnesyltransferase|tara:strand:- start:1007 stop:1906 length:900 start_codon:yes stop_codon:yes gene_type:complete
MKETNISNSKQSSWKSKIASYYKLTKPGITLYVMLTAGASHYVAVQGNIIHQTLLETLVGIALGSAGALSLNQYLERDLDALMVRTQSRPLPSGDLRPHEALLFGVTLLLGGTVYLTLTVGRLPAFLMALSAGIYLFLYTPLKTRSYLATLVGAIPGALPVLIGWSAATGSIEFGSVLISSIAFLWQLPHVLALGWLLREDYSRVGFLLTPPTDPQGKQIGRHMVYHSAALLIVSGLPTLIGMTGAIYLLGAVALGVVTLILSVLAAINMSEVSARKIFRWSLLYQPFLLSLLLIDSIR